MEIIKQEKVKSIQIQINEMEVGEIKNLAEGHKGTARSAINKLKDREFITSSTETEEGEPYLVVVRIK